MACDISLKSSRQGLKLVFKLHIDQRFAHKVMASQSRGSPNFGNFGTPILGISELPFGCPGTKCHLDARPVASHIVNYKGEGGGFPQVQAVVSFVNPSLPVARFSTKSALAMH